MLLTSSRIWVAAAFIALAALSAPAARADGKNEVRAVTFDEDAGITRVHVRGAQTPTFTVYKLERPSRVVIDLPQAKLGETLRGHEGATTLSSNTWAVSTIAAQQLDDGGGAVVRVIVTLARPGRYDVKTDGNEVVVMVTARDPVPKTASPEQLAAAQKEAEQAKQDAANAQAEAERLRKAADDAKKQSSQANRAEIERAKADADRAKADADRAKEAAAQAQADADRMRDAAEHAKNEAIAEATRAKQETAQTKADAAKAQAQAQNEIDRANRQATDAQADAARTKSEADRARAEATRAKAEADKIKNDAAKSKAEIDRAKEAASKAQAEADKKVADAERARRAAEDAAQADAAKAKQQLADAQAEADAAKSEAQRAKDEIARVKAEADQAKADAARAKKDADSARTAAATERKQADADKAKAEQMMKDAKQQLGSIDQKIAAAQAMEDKARAAHAAAQAREEAARDAVQRADKERIAAEQAAKAAAEARDRSTSQAQSERDRLASEAKAAEQKVAQAKAAAEQAESRRAAAESATSTAKTDLEQTRGALAKVEQQRETAEQAASEAARKKTDAEAAASVAADRRDEAEKAASIAAKHRDEAEKAATAAAQKRGEAESARVVAEQQKRAAEEAAKAAQAAKDAAEHQRQVAEASAAKAESARQKAEDGVAELSKRRKQAEAAAAELEARSKAAAKAQSELAAREARKASDDELAAARKEVDRLAGERKHAEQELADRRKAVASQQAEEEKLRTAASDARDAADREETRRAQLAHQRAEEEKSLDRIKAEKAKQVAQVDHDANKPKGKVTAIAFDADTVAIATSGDVKVKMGEAGSNVVELVIDNADLAQKLEKKLDTSKLGGVVKSLSTFRDRRNPDRVLLVAELSSPVTPTLDKTSTGVRWNLGEGTVAKRDAAPKDKDKARTQDVPTPVVGGYGASSTPVAQQSVAQLPPQGSRRKIFHGATVDFDFKDAPIHDLLRIIADTGHISIVVPESINAKVTVRLKRVPWDQALEVILASYGLWYRREGNLYRVAPRKDLDAEDEAEAARRAAQIQAEVPRPEVVTMNYASAAELAKKLEPMLSPKGKIEVDERTNSLIINDVAGNRAEITKLALGLDTQTPQISIEARIVEANSDFKRQIGVQWGGRALSGAQWGNATGLLFPSSIQIAGANEDSNTINNGVALPSQFAVNIPASTGSGEGGALGISLGSVAGTFDINLRLSALEDTSTVRIISAPKVTVLNNTEAKISQGVSIPISVVSAAGTQTQFVQADLSLTVTPYVSQRDCAIAMKLVVTKNEPDFQQTGARGDPTILRKEARTSMLVADGETAVLGGIYTRNSGLQYKKVPWFADLPVIGYLFKNRSENDDRTEILVFITPKITNKGSLRCQ